MRPAAVTVVSVRLLWLVVRWLQSTTAGKLSSWLQQVIGALRREHVYVAGLFRMSESYFFAGVAYN